MIWSNSSAFIQTRNPSSFGCGFRRILYVIGLVGGDSIDESDETETTEAGERVRVPVSGGVLIYETRALGRNSSGSSRSTTGIGWPTRSPREVTTGARCSTCQNSTSSATTLIRAVLLHADPGTGQCRYPPAVSHGGRPNMTSSNQTNETEQFTRSWPDKQIAPAEVRTEIDCVIFARTRKRGIRAVYHSPVLNESAAGAREQDQTQVI